MVPSKILTVEIKHVEHHLQEMDVSQNMKLKTTINDNDECADGIIRERAGCRAARSNVSQNITLRRTINDND